MEDKLLIDIDGLFAAGRERGAARGKIFGILLYRGLCRCAVPRGRAGVRRRRHALARGHSAERAGESRSICRRDKRNSALNMLKARRSKGAAKRMSPSLSMSCRSVYRVPNTEQQADTVLLREAVNGFLNSRAGEANSFIQRYWYILGISEIAAERYGQGAVKMSLKQTRDSRNFLEKGEHGMKKEDLLKAVGGADDGFKPRPRRK